jgi:hypothetical protein
VLKGPSKALRRRLAELEAKCNQQFVPFDYKAAATALRELVTLISTNRLCMIPQPPDPNPSPAKAAADKHLDMLRDRCIMENERKAKEAKRAEKLARRAARRAQAALQRPEPAPALEHGQPENAA